MAKKVFKSAVIHDGQLFVTGEVCPDHLQAEMEGKGLIKPLVEATKPGETLSVSDKALKDAADAKAKAEADEKAKAAKK